MPPSARDAPLPAFD